MAIRGRHPDQCGSSRSQETIAQIEFGHAHRGIDTMDATRSVACDWCGSIFQPDKATVDDWNDYRHSYCRHTRAGWFWICPSCSATKKAAAEDVNERTVREHERYLKARGDYFEEHPFLGLVFESMAKHRYLMIRYQTWHESGKSVTREHKLLPIHVYVGESTEMFRVDAWNAGEGQQGYVNVQGRRPQDTPLRPEGYISTFYSRCMVSGRLGETVPPDFIPHQGVTLQMQPDSTTRCPNCSVKNRDHARFCAACGATLPRRCNHCGSALSQTAQFCAICGTPVRPSAILRRGLADGLLPGTVLEGRYRLERLLGAGGFARVYLAHDKTQDALCAIKELTDNSPENQRQFEREASLLLHLRHPRLVHVRDYFQTEAGEMFLVMDYIPGDDLEQLLGRTMRGFPEDQVVRWALQICEVLEYMHSWIHPKTGQPSPVIHRDIKPGNLKLQADGSIVVIDLGIAKVKEDGGKTTRAAKAISPPYSPIEQYGLGTDERSDIYALGATLYHLSTGHEPPESPDLLRLTLVPPRQLNPTLSPRFQEVILKAMQPRPEDRFQTLRDMKIALRGYSHICAGDQDNFHYPSSEPSGEGASGYVKRGLACLEEKEWQEAITDYTRALALEPDNPVAFAGRGFARQQQGDLTGAIADFSRAVELGLSHPIGDRLRPMLRQAYFQRGRARAAQGDVVGAIADYDRAIELDPNHAAAFNNRGIAHTDQGNLAEAMADYNRAIALDPSLGEAYANRGLARADKGDLAGAVEDHDRAIRLLPIGTSRAGAYFNRALARTKQGNLRGAIADYNRAVELDPSFAEAYYNRACLHALRKNTKLKPK